MIKINPKKIYKLPFIENGEELFTVTWQFPYSTDDKFKKLRSKENKDDFDNLMIGCITGWDGIIDSETDAPVPVNDDNKKAVYDLVRYNAEYMFNVTISSLGAAGKNLNAGAMLQSIQNGELNVASTASESVDQPSPANT